MYTRTLNVTRKTLSRMYFYHPPLETSAQNTRVKTHKQIGFEIKLFVRLQFSYEIRIRFLQVHSMHLDITGYVYFTQWIHPDTNKLACRFCNCQILILSAQC